MGSFWIDSPTYGRHEVLYDDEDWELIKDHQWWLKVSILKDGSKILYAHAHNKYIDPDILQSTIIMHRVVTEAPDGLNVDHINHNGLDNRKTNLRLVTFQQNIFNTRGWSKSTSKYKGVSWDTAKSKWAVNIRCNGKDVFLGFFCNEDHAAQVYDLHAMKLFGKFGYLNFKDNDYVNNPPSLIVDSKLKQSSLYTGASWNKQRQLWECSIMVNRVTTKIGFFENEIDAAKAYNKFIIDNGLDRKLNDVGE